MHRLIVYTSILVNIGKDGEEPDWVVHGNAEYCIANLTYQQACAAGLSGIQEMVAAYRPLIEHETDKSKEIIFGFEMCGPRNPLSKFERDQMDDHGKVMFPARELHLDERFN